MFFEKLVERTRKLSILSRSALYPNAIPYPPTTIFESVALAEVHLSHSHHAHLAGGSPIGYWNEYDEKFVKPRSLVIQDFVFQIKHDNEEEVTLFLGKPDGYLIDLVKAYLLLVQAHVLDRDGTPFEKMQIVPHIEDESVKQFVIKASKGLSFHGAMINIKKQLALGRVESALLCLFNYLYATEKIIEFENCVELFFNYDQARRNYPIEVGNEEGETVSTPSRESESEAVQPEKAGGEALQHVVGEVQAGIPERES